MGLAAAVALTAAILIGVQAVITAGEQTSTRECEDLGFSGLALCSDCHAFSEYVKDQGLPKSLSLLIWGYDRPSSV
ncbi:hypothetical protein MLD38_010697 [Melastoma candidum]|uniref:Uncharacterized protein n=1 Tax=Melastoma candidum TaxID=119954 RepID=A0ACB9R3R5_9MYRT|nr:hypothetical protein MLD38_010697 [Melastoma candidum]